MSDSTSVRDPNFVPGGTIGVIEQLDLIDARPITVAIVDGAGDQITSFGGGTQYADGAARGSAIGTIAMGDDGTNIQSIHVDSSGDLQIDVLTMPTVAVTGTFWQATQPVSLATNTPTLQSGSTTAVTQATGTNLHMVVDSGTITTVSALGVGTTGPQKAEDVAHSSGDMGILAMASRLDTPVANAGVSNDGDYTGLVLDNFRKLWVTGTVPEDTAHVAGEAILQGGVRRIDTAATSAGTSGDWATMDASAEGALWSTLTPTTTSGLTTAMFSGSDGSTILVATAQVIKASAGNLYGYYFYNPESAVTFVHFYNTAAASVTVGTTNPLFTIPVPATSAANLSFPYPVGFSNAGWSIAATTTAGGNTAPATGVSAVIWFK